MYYYKEYHPAAPLTHWVETYWTASGFVRNEASKIPPDGCVDIIFSFDRAKGGFSADLVGTMTTFLEVAYSQSVQMFGIRFKPAGITAFTRVPVEEFTDRMVELALVETLFGASFCEALAEKRSVAEMVACADAYLIRLLSRAYGFDRQIVRAVDLICFSEGRISPVAVADDICLCQRHFERKFKAAIGVSPKSFANVFRFKRALRLLKSDPHKDLLTLAVECGYYDQSHLIKDFKRLSGDAPADFRR